MPSIVHHLLEHGVPDMLGTIFRLGDELALTDLQARQHLAMMMGAAYGLVSSRLQEPASETPANIVRDSLNEALTWMTDLLGRTMRKPPTDWDGMAR